MSNIEWTEVTWNPTVGCTEVSAGCLNCYAAKMAWRIAHMNNKAAVDYAGTVKKINIKDGKKVDRVVWTGQVNILTDRLLQPARNKKPTTYFVDSMSDLFHESIPFAFIDKVFAVMMLCPQHIFQVLTKRTARMLEYCQSRQDMDEITEEAEMLVLENMELFYELEKHKFEGKTIAFPSNKLLAHLSTFGWYSGFSYVDDGQGDCEKEHEFFFEKDFPAKHIWMGTSIEDQKAADQRGGPLYDIHRLGWVTWVSNEPMIGPVDWETPNYFGFLNWIVTGGESGSKARPMHPDWVRASRDFCENNKIPFFFKQWGAWSAINKPWFDDNSMHEPLKQNEQWLNLAGGSGFHGDEVWRMKKVGKYKAGRLLDGKLHDAYPEIIRNPQITKP